MKAEVGNRYVHYKNGNTYVVIAIGRLESNPIKEYVVYRAEYDSLDYGNNATWIRARDNFEDEVYYNGVRMHRFTALERVTEDNPGVEEEEVAEEDI